MPDIKPMTEGAVDEKKYLSEENEVETNGIISTEN